MATQDVWTDFETVRHNVKHNTVDRLKQILSSFNDHCGTNFTKTGKKQELIDRVTRELDLWRRTSSTQKWVKGKEILNQVRGSMHNPYRPNGDSSYGQFQSAAPTMYASSTTAASVPQYDPYARQRPPAPAASVASTSSAATAGIQFKHSPFFRVERAVSNIVECPESTSQMDRRQQSFSFIMSSDILSKLTSQSSKYQLRLYCTSSTYYSPTPSFRPNLGPCPVEFPPTCEVRVNNVQLSANLKGMKKKPGTAPPPDLGKNIRLTSGSNNRIEMVYVNSQQPTPSKKYYLVVMLVEVTTVEQLIDRLKKGKYRSSNDILAKMRQAASEDDDIVAGHQKMSLKCPLSYMRISTPCRSSQCVHSQCFDAFSWYSVMEQTTTWLCPVCEKVLNTEELIVDGYFDVILKSTPEDVEDVIVEADGQWHTADNQYASDDWKAAHPPTKAVALSLPPTPVKQRSLTPVKPLTNGFHPSSEVITLDSDDEDEGQVKRELSPTVPRSLNRSFASIGSLPPRSRTTSVIDLTLDSEDEDAPVPLSQSKKRKADTQEILSPTEQIWKKSRAEGTSLPSVAAITGGASKSYTNGHSYSTTPPPSRDTRVAPSSPESRLAGRSLFAGSSYIPPGGAPVPSRPAAPYHGSSSRVNGTSSTHSWRAF